MAVTEVRTTAAPARPTASRLVGVDLARAVAMFGMLVVHTLPVGGVISLEDTLWWLHGRSAALFVLLAGMGLTFACRSVRSTRARSFVLVRTLPLLLIGLLMETQMYGCILQYYALYFVVGVLAVRSSRRTLLLLAAAGTIAGPFLVTFLAQRGTITLATHFDGQGPSALGHPLRLLQELGVDGLYPAVVWCGYLFTGMALATCDLGSARLQRAMVVGGGAVAVAAQVVGDWGVRRYGTSEASFTHEWTTVAHSEGLAWTVTSLGSAVAALGVCLMIAARWAAVPRPAAPLLALGRCALTFYVLHLWYVDTLWARWLPHITSDLSYVLATLAFFTVACTVAQLWTRAFTRGPFELVLHTFATAVVRPTRVARPVTG